MIMYLFLILYINIYPRDKSEGIFKYTKLKEKSLLRKGLK